MRETKRMRARSAFMDEVYQLLRHPPKGNSTSVGQLTIEQTAIYDAIVAAFDRATETPCKR